MIRLKKIRLSQGRSQRSLMFETGLDAALISKAETRGLVLYPKQATKLAKALGYPGDPMELFEEVDCHDQASL